MTIDDAIAVTEMTTDVATILSKILLKSCLLTYFMFSIIHFSFLLVFTFKPKCFWFQCERVPLRPVGCGRLMGAWMLKSRGVCCIARLYRGQACFYPWHRFSGPFGGSLSRSSAQFIKTMIISWKKAWSDDGNDYIIIKKNQYKYWNRKKMEAGQ